MHAYEIPDLRYSLPAGEAITNRCFVSVNAASEGILATAAGSAIGVSMNEVKKGEVLEVADGIVLVTASAPITAGTDVEVGVNGSAITKTTGVGVGVALTGATAPGQPVAVKIVSVSNANGADGADAPIMQTLMFTSSDLAAGVDITKGILGVVPAIYDATVTDVQIVSAGSASGIDDTNTSVFLLEGGSTPLASVSFDDTQAFPASGVASAMDITEDSVFAGSVLFLSVTNGATVDLPIFMVQVTLTLVPAV